MLVVDIVSISFAVVICNVGFVSAFIVVDDGSVDIFVPVIIIVLVVPDVTIVVIFWVIVVVVDVIIGDA